MIRRAALSEFRALKGRLLVCGLRFDDREPAACWLKNRLIDYTVTADRDDSNAHDIHCLYSPDRTCFIGDDYPRNDFTRRILYYDFKTKHSGEILSLFSDERGNTDIRCDLHNRFSPDGKLVSFDTNYTGHREMLMFPFDKQVIFD